MKNWQTSVSVRPNGNKIDYNSKILLLGSCFTENIGKKLLAYRFDTRINPYGILFHPYAILRFLRETEGALPVDQEAFVAHQHKYSYLHAHSKLSAKTEERLRDKLVHALAETRHFIKTCTHVLLTLGTAWGYRHKDLGCSVANCHKLPQKNFDKDLSSAEDIRIALMHSVKLLKNINPDLKVVFTISPVRHIKDGIVENHRSKAHLTTALHAVVDATEATYFPAYEIMMDELRDYRFYERDMIHPSQLAIDHIWSKFAEAHIDQEALRLFPRIDSLAKGKEHRPFDPDSEGHQIFKKNLRSKERELDRAIALLRQKPC